MPTMSSPSSTSSPPASTPLPQAGTVASPCRSLCKLDEDQVCTGCGRTIDDIRSWRAMDDTARLACIARAQSRRAAWDVQATR